MASLRAGPSRLVTRAFSTSAPTYAAVGPKRKELITKVMTRQGMVKKNRTNESRGTSGGRIVLHYSNPGPAPDLSALEPFRPELVKTDNIGQPTRLTDRGYKALQEFGLPLRIRDQMTKAGGPAFVIRDHTVNAVQTLEKAGRESSKDNRYMFTGARGSGKSVTLLQAVHHAIERDWLVLYIPSTSPLVGSKNRFEYSPETQIYHQPELSSNLLQHFVQANERQLRSLHIEPQPDVGGARFQNTKDMLQLIEKARRDVDIAPMVLRAVLKAVAGQKTPILLAIDEVQALFGLTKYRTPEYLPVEAYHLSVPLLLLDYLVGRETFNHGCVMTAMSYSADGAYRPPKALRLGLGLPAASQLIPYDNINDVHAQHASSGIHKIDLSSMSPVEAAGMYKIWTMKGWVRRTSDEGFLNALQSSSGNPMELIKAMRYDYNVQAVTPPSY